VPSHTFRISPRIDFEINNKKHAADEVRLLAFVERISRWWIHPTVAWTNSASTQHTIQLTESMIINPTTVMRHDSSSTTRNRTTDRSSGRCRSRRQQRF